MICAWVGDGLTEVGAVVEVVIITITITVTVAMRQLMRVRCTTFNRHHIVMGGVATPMITRTVLLHTLLGRRHHINTGKGTHPGHTRRRPLIAGTLTRMAVGESHHGRCLVRTVGADTTLDPRAEADTVEAIEEDIIAVVAVVIVMEIAEVALAMLHHIRAATILAPTTEDIAQGAEAHREDAVEDEATELWSPIMATLFFFTHVPGFFRALRLRRVIRYLRTEYELH